MSEDRPKSKVPQSFEKTRKKAFAGSLEGTPGKGFAYGVANMQVKLVSWNVNGLRAVSGKPDWSWFNKKTADIIGLQETKALPEQLDESISSPEGWNSYFASSTVKKGYSGVAVFSQPKPLSVRLELPVEEYQGEGRIIHAEYEKFHFINGYFPNGGAEILDDNGKHQGKFKRLEYKMGFFDAFLAYAEELRKARPVVVCGDFNIAHKEIDLARPKQNVMNTGFLAEERAFLDKLVSMGWIDTFRHVHGDVADAYSWWSYKMKAREKNIGWRIDYFFVTEDLRDHIADAWIENTQFGSDHCPVGLALKF